MIGDPAVIILAIIVGWVLLAVGGGLLLAAAIRLADRRAWRWSARPRDSR